MSSEMRELIQKWRNAIATDRKQPMRMLENVYLCQGMESCADELEALLARTEAVADGAVDSRAAFERWAKPQGYRLHIRDIPGSARLGQYGDDSTQAAWEAWTASRTTRPQDASGDAVTGRVNGYMFSARAIEIITDGEVPEWITKTPGLRVTITAMQAKEAAE